MTVRRNHRTEARGVEDISRLVDPSGTARTNTTVVAVTGVVEEWLSGRRSTG